MDQDGLRQLEDQCIQEHAPACMASCPARVDARAICVEVEKGDFAAGYKILRKAIPFPGIISRICDEPCRSACIRKDVGMAISIANLERACSDYAGTYESVPVLPRRDKSLAIIGSGLSGLTVGYDLARKGYHVHVFEKESRIGGNIWHYPDSRLAKSIIENDLAVIQQVGITIQLNTLVKIISPFENSKYQIHNEMYDAVFIGTGFDPVETLGTKCNLNGIIIDQVTYETNLPGIFSGGGAIIPEPDRNKPSSLSPILAISDGHRVATSIDRYLQKVSMSASRIREGAYETKLYTNINGIIPSDVIQAQKQQQGYSIEEAKQEASRCLKCDCMECVKVCEYLKEYGSYPKRYVREIYNNLSIVKGERRKNQFINSCSLCGLCAEVCPTDLDMGTVCLESRREMVSSNRMPPSAHDFALRDMQFSNSNKFSLVRNQPGTTKSKYLFFPGCQLSASNPDYIEAIYAQLRNIPEMGAEGVGLALRCCGAPAEWAGEVEIFNKTRIAFLDEYKSLGTPEIILACSSCYHIFKKYYPEIQIRSLWTLLDELNFPIPTSIVQKPVIAIHDPCTTRYESEIQDSIRNLVIRMGYRVEELPFNRENTECCSYGGLMWLANGQLAKKAVDRRINESPRAYVTYCAMCRDMFTKHGKQTYHLLDLLFSDSEVLLNSKLKAPDYSTRHENRVVLKKKLLKDLWGETMEDVNQFEKIQLIISEEMRTVMEERLILVEDVQKVIMHAKKTGMVLYNQKNNHILTYFCPAYVTYWVEFAKEGDAYKIFNTYSHRMTIEEGAKT